VLRGCVECVDSGGGVLGQAGCSFSGLYLCKNLLCLLGILLCVCVQFH
jgi:hypothetical protein